MLTGQKRNICTRHPSSMALDFMFQFLQEKSSPTATKRKKLCNKKVNKALKNLVGCDGALLIGHWDEMFGGRSKKINLGWEKILTEARDVGFILYLC